ncbi:unnamed protein product, partial [Symbiodinium sp. CCMP2456]
DRRLHVPTWAFLTLAALSKVWSSAPLCQAAFGVAPLPGKLRRHVPRRYREGDESWSLRGPVSKLLGVAEDDFLEQNFGVHWLHAKDSALHLPFTVEDCLSLVSDFDAELHAEACSKRKLSYGEHRAVLDDVSKRVAFGARATQIWSGSSVNFWSVAICRTLAGSLERLEDHKYVAQILREQPLRCSDDLARHGRNWTFIFNKAHAAKAELHSLHHALWACFGVSGDFNVYLTPPSSQGLAPHADRHDVFVAQQEGEKTWTLLEPDKVRVLENVTLLPGDVLYLPQGVPHYARSAGEGSSLHVTMSVYRGHFTFAGLLAAWLEVQASAHSELFDLSLANRIDATQTRLTDQGLEEANRPLPPSFWPLLRALDSKDFPKGAAEAAVAEAQLLAAQLAGRLRGKSEADDASIVGRLEALGEGVDEQRLRSFLEGLFATRELRWIKHYRLYGPKTLRGVEVANLPANALLRRAPDAAAMKTRRGELLLNGFLISGLPLETEAALRFCLGRYTGSAGQPFQLKEMPGPEDVAESLVRLLLQFDGLEYMGVPEN